MNRRFTFPKGWYHTNYLLDYDNSIEMSNARNIVFLDIDGVINANCDEKYLHNLHKTAEYLAWKYHDDIYTKMREVDVGAAYYDWDSLAIGRLKQFLFDQEAEVVIHSDYARDCSLEELKALFRLHAMDDYIYDKCRRGYKKEIIQEYLALNKDTGIIQNYVIFDDDPSVQFDDHFVLTKHLLTEENIKEAAEILNK